MTSKDFTPEEQAAIDELKRRTIDIVTPRMLQDNYLFYRFAKARNYNVAEAESMLRKHLSWRKEFDFDNLLKDYKPLEVFVKCISTCMLGFDKSGCAIRYLDCGQLDCKGLWNSAREKDVLKFGVYCIEQDFEALLQRHEQLHKQIYVPIFNFHNFQYSTATHMKSLQYGLHFLKTYVDNFPEWLKCAFVINAPFYFIWVYTIFKQVLPDTVVEKVRVYGSDGWKEDLLEMIDADELPAFLGGNKIYPDGNPLCKFFRTHGETIPKSYYMESTKKRLRAGCEKMTIPPFSKEQISFEVKEENSILHWEFEVKSGDIEFSLHFKREKLKTETILIPKQRFDTDFDLEKGLFECTKLGTYTIVLDNTYSWLHWKEVYYRAAVVSPNDDKSEQWLW